MLTFKKILFPVDFSERCRGAARFVAAFAGRFESELILLHALEWPTEAYGPFEYDRQESKEIELANFLTKEFEPLEAQKGPAPTAAGSVVGASLSNVQTGPAPAAPGSVVGASFSNAQTGPAPAAPGSVVWASFSNVRRIVQTGDPARTIVSLAHDEKVDLIMMPTHGYGTFRRFVLGSVTAKVLHDADCPVWTGVHLEEAPPLESISIRNIVCAIDLDQKSIGVLRFAGRLSEEYGAKLTVVHAIPATEARPEKYFDAELRKFLFDSAREEIGKLLQEAGLEAQICLDGGEIAKVVHHAASNHKADLTVIGRSSPGLLGRLRTHSYAIVRDSPCPVLSV